MPQDEVFPDSVKIYVGLDGSEIWTEILDVVNTSPINIDRGNSGTSQKDRVAQTGGMDFQVNNAENNSGGVLGYYSPNNMSCLAGWRVGIPVKCVVTYLGIEYLVFIGLINTIEPVSGKFGVRKVEVTCTDWMEEAAQSRIRGLETQINERSSTVFQQVAEAVENPPPGGFDIQFGADVFPYALDSAHEGELNAMSEFQRICQSELSRVFVSREGVAVYESRHYRPNNNVVFESLTDDDIVSLETGRGRSDIINHVEAKAHPRRVDDAPTVVLFELAQPKKIALGETVQINVLFRDPDSRATRVGARDMVQPQPTTDYTFNSQQDGLGTDRTANIAVSVVYSANGGLASVTNNGPGDGFLTKLHCRGRGIYDYEAVIVTADDQASKDKYKGETPFTLDMPYQADFGVAKDAAEFVLNLNKELWTQIRGCQFFANREHRLMLAALTGEISNKVGLTETVVGSRAFTEVETGTAEITIDTFFINFVRLEIRERAIIRVTWALEPADPFAYWILDDAELSVLGFTTRLAYGAFQTGWILDQGMLGIDTILGSS